MCPTNSNCLPAADEDFAIDDYPWTKRLRCGTRTKTNGFVEDDVEARRDSDDTDRCGFQREDYYSESETFEHYAKDTRAKYEKSDKSQGKATESRRDFYRLNSRDDRFVSESADESLSGPISGTDYRYFSYREKCLEYLHFCVESKSVCRLGYDNVGDLPFNDRDFETRTSEFCNCSHRSEAETREDTLSASSTEESGVRVSKNLETKFSRLNETSRKRSENKRTDSGVHFKSQKFNRDDSLSSRKTLRRIENFEYSRKSPGNSLRENYTCYVKVTRIEETLKMSKSNRSVKIRSLLQSTPIKRPEMARVKKCAQFLFRDSADDDASMKRRPASEFLCNEDCTRFHARESRCNEINVRKEKVTWICKISVVVRRSEGLH